MAEENSNNNQSNNDIPPSEDIQQSNNNAIDTSNDDSQSQNTSLLNEINNRILGIQAPGSQSPDKRAKKLQQKYGKDLDSNKHYQANRLKRDKVEEAKNTTEPVAKPNALRLADQQRKFDKRAKGIRNALNRPDVTGPNANPKSAQKALEIVDKLENKERQEAAKMKREIRTIKQQEAIAKAGPYGRLVAMFLGCKNWCLGHAVIICTVTGGLGYVVLKLTGAI